MTSLALKIGLAFLVWPLRVSVGAQEASTCESNQCGIRIERTWLGMRLVEKPADSVVARLGLFGRGIEQVRWGSDSARFYASRYTKLAASSSRFEYPSLILGISAVVLLRPNASRSRSSVGAGLGVTGLLLAVQGTRLQKRANRSLRDAVRFHNSGRVGPKLMPRDSVKNEPSLEGGVSLTMFRQTRTALSVGTPDSASLTPP